MTSKISSTFVMGIAAALVLSADVALGCPMCKQAAETDPRLPQAFMLSILFMMSVPFALVSGFGFAFWRLSKQAEELNAAAESFDPEEDR